jgi:serine/arginine repetitive matrix protein 1
MLTHDCCRWIAKRISDILGNEDDVVIELCFNLLEGSRYVCCLFAP